MSGVTPSPGRILPPNSLSPAIGASCPLPSWRPPGGRAISHPTVDHGGGRSIAVRGGRTATGLGKSRAARVRSAGTEQPLTLGRPHQRQVERPAVPCRIGAGTSTAETSPWRSVHQVGGAAATAVGTASGSHLSAGAHGCFAEARVLATSRRGRPRHARETAARPPPVASPGEGGSPKSRSSPGRWSRRSSDAHRPVGKGGRCLPGAHEPSRDTLPCAAPQDPGCAPAARGRPAGGPAQPGRFRSACAGGPGADGARAIGRQGFSGEPGATARCRRPGHGGGTSRAPLCGSGRDPLPAGP